MHEFCVYYIHRVPPEALIKDCKRRIKFYVIIDKSIWYSGIPPPFVVSLISKEINNGQCPYGEFKRLDGSFYVQCLKVLFIY